MHKHWQMIMLCSVGLVLIVLTVSCKATPTPAPILRATDPTLMDKSWLTDTPCRAPCWYGLEPGISTKEEVLSVMQDLPFLDANTLQEKEARFYDPAVPEGIPGEHVWVECKDPRRQQCVYMQFMEGLLEMLLLSPNYDITFKEAVDHLGNPDGISVSRRDAEAKGCDATLTWNDRQLEVRHYEGRRFSGDDLCDIVRNGGDKMPPDLIIYSIRIMHGSLLQDTIFYNEAWKGFGEVSQ